MRKAILVALAVCSVSALAQEAVTDPATEAPVAEAPRRDPSVRAGREHSVLRELGYGVLGYLGGGLAGGLVGAGVGFVAGLALANGYLLLFGIAGGAIVGTALGTAYGVWFGGDDRGSIWGAILGVVVGAGLSFLPAALNQGYVQFVVFPPLGALIGYEISRALIGPSTPVTLAPFTTPGGGGGLALGGVF